MNEYIYILELNGGNFYIGKTNDLARRFKQHKDGLGDGSEWTRKHGGIKLIDIYPVTGMLDELSHTLTFMKEYGIDKVRGGLYTKIILSQSEIDYITSNIRAANNLCMQCGSSEHFIKTCLENNIIRKRNVITEHQISPPMSIPEIKTNQKIIVSDYTDELGIKWKLLTGCTYNLKSKIKIAGGIYNPSLKGWLLSTENYEKTSLKICND